MEYRNPMGRGCDTGVTDHGPDPFAAHIMCQARQNQNFRTAFWTGEQLQMTLMSIPVRGEIGTEMHSDTDQVIRVEAGQALVRMGHCREEMDFQRRLNEGDALFVPCGTWHNVLNAGNCLLKLSSIYAPPKHPRGTVHRTKADAADEKY